MRNTILKTILIIGLLFASSSSFPENIVDKVLSYPRIGDIGLSPDGQQVAYTTSEVVSTAKGKERNYFLFLQNNAGKTMQIIKSEHVALPVWSSDGKRVAFLENKDKEQAIKIYNLANNQTQTLVSLTDRNISAFKFSPDGSKIAFVADTEKKPVRKDHNAIDVEHDYKNARIYLVGTTGNATITPLTSDQISIAQFFIPSLDGGFDWSPDGKTIAYSYQERAGSDFIYRIKTKIALINLDNKKITELPYTADHAGGQPVFSPDGKWVAFHTNLTNYDKNILFYEDPDNNGQICVASTENLATHCLANTANENPFIIGWSASSKSIYAFDWYKAIGPQIYELNTDPAIAPKLVSNQDGFIQPLTMAFNAKRNYFAFGYEKITQQPQIYRASVDHFQLDQLTQFTDVFKNNLGTAETIHWKSRNNLDIEGILIKPADYDPAKKYPLLVTVHGGPSGAFALRYQGGCDEYGDMILPACTQVILNSGFLILEPNYRGSTGYGKSFRAANVGDFGGGDFQDVMTGIDYLVDKNIVDPNHLAIFGWSYGGYMTDWAITQTNRFKAAVSGGGLSDLLSFEGTTDIPSYLIKYLSAAVWDDNKLYLQRSAVLFSKNVQTPLLLMHGKNDPRVPVTQSYEFYHLLKLQNKPVKLVVYSDQEHTLTDGNVIYESQIEANEWLKKAIN